jgi:hypothetical protein
MRDLSQGTSVMFLTSWVGWCEHGRLDFVVVVGRVGCEVRVGCGVGSCEGDGVEPF